VSSSRSPDQVVCVHQALTAGPTERHVNLMATDGSRQ
jgi:hypothetical protein